jgi:hypothetical protein
LRGEITGIARDIAGSEMTWRDRLRISLKKFAANAVSSMAFLWDWLFSERMVENLVRQPGQQLYQFDSTCARKRVLPGVGSDLKAAAVGLVQYKGDESDLQKSMKITKEFLPQGTIIPDGVTLDDWEKMPEAIKLMYVSVTKGTFDEESGNACLGLSFPQVQAALPENVLRSKFENFLKQGGKITNDHEFTEAFRSYYQWEMNNAESNCQVCKMLHGAVGNQVVDCMHKEDSYVEFAMTQEEVNTFRDQIKEQSVKESSKFADLLSAVHKILPKGPISTKCRVEYIKGGPGTGKSYLIRALADPVGDLVAAPFLKLRSDYTNQKVNGVETSWDFHTQHKALEVVGRRAVFIDEFTAYDWQLLTVLLWRNRPDVLYLVGDEQQTGIQEGKGEGINILSKIDMSKISTHIPLCNFRNPRQDVKILNHMFGTRMIPVSKNDSGYVLEKLEDFEALTSKDEQARVMHYSDETGRLMMADSYKPEVNKTTVRANQGSTYDRVLLPFTNADKKLTLKKELNFVALSRHRESLSLLLDHGETAAGYNIAMDVTNPPKEVISDDYILKLFLGMETPREGFYDEESTLIKNFRALVEKYSGYSSEGLGPDVPKITTTEVGVVESFQQLQNAFPDAPISTSLPFQVADNNVDDAVDMDLDFESEVELPDSCRHFIEERMGMSFEEHRFSWQVKAKHVMVENGDEIERREDCAIIDIDPENEHDCGHGNTSTVGVRFHDEPSSSTFHEMNSDEGCDQKDINEDDVPQDSSNERAVVSSGTSTGIMFGEFFSEFLGCPTSYEHKLVEKLQRRDNRCLLDAVTRFFGVDYLTFVKYYCNSDKLPRLEIWASSDEQSCWDDVTMFSQLCSCDITVISLKDQTSGRSLFKFLYDFPKTSSIQVEFYHVQSGQVGHFFNADEDIDLDRALEYLEESATSLNCYKNTPLIRGGKSKMKMTKAEKYESVDDLPQNFIDYATEFTSRVFATAPERVTYNQLSVKYPMRVPVNDAYLLCKGFDLAPGPTNYSSNYLNEHYSGNIGEKFVSGTLSSDFVCPLNMRGNPVNDTTTYRSLMVGPALMYFKRNRFQELQVQQARYLFRSAAKLPSGPMTKIANSIADLFVDECLTVNLEEAFSWTNLSEITERALRDMVIKNYANQMDVEFTVNARIYRFALKDIEKPIKEPTVNLSKAGQGILAWSKEAHVKFMIAFRVINDLLLKSCRDNVVYDNGMSEDEFLGKINNAMSAIPSVATNGVIDATACDSGQGPFTQLIERRIYSRLGVAPEFLDWYFSFREHYVMQSRYVRANMRYVKTSGEPATLLGNTILMGALMNGLIRGKGPMCIAMKGDDGFKRQMGMHINFELAAQIRKFTPLEFKLDLDVPITFCGYALSGGVLHSNLVRKLIKIASHRFRDYEHYAEYQESLRDWLAQIGSEPLRFQKFLEVNAELAGLSTDDMLRIYDQIVSFSRIGRFQFETTFEERTVDLNCQTTNYAEHDQSVVTAFGDPLAVFLKKNARVGLAG